MITKLNNFVKKNQDEIALGLYVGAQVVLLCALCAAVAAGTRTYTLNNLHIHNVHVGDEFVGLLIDGVYYGKK